MPTDWGEGNFPGGGPDAALVESLIRRGHIVDSQVSRARYSIFVLGRWQNVGAERQRVVPTSRRLFLESNTMVPDNEYFQAFDFFSKLKPIDLFINNLLLIDRYS